MKSVYYDDIKFTEDKKTGYYLSSVKVGGTRIRLHRYIWEKEIGEIPEGFIVHHKDCDKSNNDISNFELMERNKHNALHSNLMSDSQLCKRKENAKKMQDKATKWHKSKEGLEWHKEQYKVSLATIKEVEMLCEYCLTKYYSKPNGNNRFCSNNCKSNSRRLSGIDDIEIICNICNKKFIKNKYSKAVTCSRGCSAEYKRSKSKKC